MSMNDKSSSSEAIGQNNKSSSNEAIGHNNKSSSNEVIGQNQKAPLIYLFGFPGVGKNTIAQEIEKQSAASPCAMIAIHNHLLSNGLRHVVSRLDTESYAQIQPDLHHHTMKAWLNFLEFVSKAIPNQGLVFTSVLYQNDPDRVQFFEFIRTWAREENRPFLPVRLICDAGELQQRLQSENRKQSFKLTDPDILQNLMRDNEILSPSDCLELDITHIPAEESAHKILAHIAQHISA